MCAFNHKKVPADLSANATAAAQAAQIQRLFIALDEQAARMRNETERVTAAIAAAAEAASALRSPPLAAPVRAPRARYRGVFGFWLGCRR